MKKNILGISLHDLEKIFVEQTFPKFAAKQVYDWIYRKFELDITKWSNISKKLKEYLYDNYTTNLPEISFVNKSQDGTEKFILKLNDGQTIESVLIPSSDRLTICISSQVGCAMNCIFCHTGKMGFIRNLDSAEIVGQYMALSKYLNTDDSCENRISNIVYMGQGEPFHNFENVKNSVSVFMEPLGLGIGQRKITVSTCGIISKIEMLDNFPPVNIAVSLHSPFDNIRTELMPINKSNPLKSLINAINKIDLKAHRFITYEYLMVKDLTDRQEDINELKRILNPKTSKINLIPFNSFPESPYQPPSEDKITWFKNKLLESGYVCTMRVSKGQDILAACGQLNSKYKKA